MMWNLVSLNVLLKRMLTINSNREAEHTSSKFKYPHIAFEVVSSLDLNSFGGTLNALILNLVWASFCEQ
jgi:hypothetical protein